MNPQEKSLIDRDALLEKFPGKGGWTFVALPEIAPEKHSPFGWRLVKGRIDDCEFNNFRLMPLGNHKLFFPVKAAIRKALKKEAGDTVKLVVYADYSYKNMRPQLLECLQEEPLALKNFLSLSLMEQNHYLQQLHTLTDEEEKASRIVMLINRLSLAKYRGKPPI